MSSSAPSVSVIIPVYNGAAFVAEAIESALAQTHEPLEVIAVDDGSTDGTATVIRRFPTVTLIEQSNRGVSAARNAALETTAGEYIAFLDADDVWAPSKTEVQVAFLEAHPEHGFAYCDHRFVFERGKPAWFRDDIDPDSNAQPIPSTMMVRASAIAVAGRFNEGLRYAEDLDWLARAQEAGLSGGHVERVLTTKRIHAANLSHDVRELQQGALSALRSSLARRRAADAARTNPGEPQL